MRRGTALAHVVGQAEPLGLRPRRATPLRKLVLAGQAGKGRTERPQARMPSEVVQKRICCSMAVPLP